MLFTSPPGEQQPLNRTHPYTQPILKSHQPKSSKQPPPPRIKSQDAKSKYSPTRRSQMIQIPILLLPPPPPSAAPTKTHSLHRLQQDPHPIPPFPTRPNTLDPALLGTVFASLAARLVFLPPYDTSDFAFPVSDLLRIVRTYKHKPKRATTSLFSASRRTCTNAQAHATS